MEGDNRELMESMGKSIRTNLGDYDIVETLSKGDKSYLFKIRERRRNNQNALKVVMKKPDNIHNDSRIQEKVASRISNLKEIHQQLNKCAYIVSLGEVFDDSDNYYLMFEYCSEGDLTKQVSTGGGMEVEVIRTYGRHICEGLSQIHRHSIVHRDIKPENVVVSGEKVTKLCDFGLALKGETSKEEVGTLNYMAPEVILRKEYDKKVDIWALGCTLFYMATGTRLFNFEKHLEAFEYFRQNRDYTTNYPKVVNKQLRQLIERMVVTDPKKRPTADEVLESWFFHPGQRVRIEPLSTTGVKTTRMETSSGNIRVDQSGIAKEASRENPFQFRVNPNGSLISIHKAKHSKNYSLEQLPTKYHPLYKYLKSVAEILFQSSPATVLENKRGRFQILNSQKFVAKFSNGRSLELSESFDPSPHDDEETVLAKHYYIVMRGLT